MSVCAADAATKLCSTISVTRLDDLLKFLATSSLSKKIIDFWALFEKVQLM